MRRRGRRGQAAAPEEGSSAAEGQMYVRFAGINGSVWDGPYAGCFKISSAQYGQGRGIGGGRRGGKREMSEASVSEMTISVPGYDAKWNVMHGLATAGACFPETCVYSVTPDSTTTFRLSQVVISGFSYSADASNASISVSLNYVELVSEVTTVVRRPIAVPSSLVGIAPHAQTADIGKDGFLNVFRWLSPAQLLQCALTCKQWLHYASDPRLELKETSCMEYHPNANTVINGYRIPRSHLTGFKNGGSDNEEEEKPKDEAPKIFGKELHKGVQLPFARSLFAEDK